MGCHNPSGQSQLQHYPLCRMCNPGQVIWAQNPGRLPSPKGSETRLLSRPLGRQCCRFPLSPPQDTGRPQGTFAGPERVLRELLFSGHGAPDSWGRAETCPPTPTPTLHAWTPLYTVEGSGKLGEELGLWRGELSQGINHQVALPCHDPPPLDMSLEFSPCPSGKLFLRL